MPWYEMPGGGFRAGVTGSAGSKGESHNGLKALEAIQLMWERDVVSRHVVERFKEGKRKQGREEGPFTP